MAQRAHSAPIDMRLPVLDLGKPVYVRKTITTHGQLFSPGVEFPWRKLGYREDKVRQLYRSGHLTPKVRALASVPAAPTPVVPPVSAGKPIAQRPGVKRP